MSRLPLHKIDIPSHRPEWLAAGVVMQKLNDLRIDQRKAIGNPMLRQLCIDWTRGKMTDAEFEHCCENMKILNPGLVRGK